MSITLPSSKPEVALGRYQLAQNILASDWKNLAKLNHYTFARTISRVGGVVWRDSPWRTTSASETVTDANSGRDLDTYTPVIEMPKIVEISSAFWVSVTVEAYVENAIVNLYAERLDTGVTASALGAINPASGSPQHLSGALEISWANNHEGGSLLNDVAQWMIYARAYRDTHETFAHIHALTFYTTIVTASMIPTDSP